MPQHKKLLDESAIMPAVAAARGYRSVTDPQELAALGFRNAQLIAPTLLIPIHTVAGGTPWFYQHRPDQPRSEVRDGKTRVIKYETLPRQNGRPSLVLDVPPIVRPWLQDPTRPLWITEGSRKVDSAVSRGLCCIGVLGVWGWRGTNELGGRAALPDWDSIALNREVYIAFDADVMVKTEVHQSLERFKAFLESRGG